MPKPPITSDNAKAIRYIQEGRVVAFPTGTSYGLAADALQGNALQRLRNLKHRPQEKTFTVFLDPALISDYFTVSSREKTLLDQLTNRSATILLRPQASLRHLAQDGRVGLRLIDHPVMRQLALLAQTPLTATSANLTDQEPCFTPDCVRQAFPWEQTPDTFDLSLAAIVDGGPLPSSLPSTILQLRDGAMHVIRPGATDPASLRLA